MRGEKEKKIDFLKLSQFICCVQLDCPKKDEFIHKLYYSVQKYQMNKRFL